MYFSGRQIKPYAEPVVVESLVKGEVYFSVNFVDEAMRLPVLLPVVFIGQLEGDGLEGGFLCFQDLESHSRGVRYGDGSNRPAEFTRGRAIGHIFEYEKALEVLMARPVRRRS